MSRKIVIAGATQAIDGNCRHPTVFREEIRPRDDPGQPDGGKAHIEPRGAT
jgi:hypothetical protein